MDIVSSDKGLASVWSIFGLLRDYAPQAPLAVLIWLYPPHERQIPDVAAGVPLGDPGVEKCPIWGSGSGGRLVLMAILLSEEREGILR